MFDSSNNSCGKRWMISGCLVLFCLGLIGCSAKKDPTVSKKEEQITREHKQEYEAGMEAGD